jgi:C4-dicarboxylate-specific signal transduction histidine kinase
VVIEDEGPGLSAQVKARLFEPFFTTKEAGKGTGLGLAVSRHLLSQFEGQLEVGDRPGGGARFTIALPAP